MTELPVISDCNDCGACCRNMVSPPFISAFGDDHEFDALPKSLKDELHHFYDSGLRKSLPEDWPCMWLDLATMKCRHYEHRPEICRDFEMGSDDCREHRKTWGVV